MTAAWYESQGAAAGVLLMPVGYLARARSASVWPLRASIQGTSRSGRTHLPLVCHIPGSSRTATELA